MSIFFLSQYKGMLIQETVFSNTLDHQAIQSVRYQHKHLELSPENTWPSIQLSEELHVTTVPIKTLTDDFCNSCYFQGQPCVKYITVVHPGGYQNIAYCNQAILVQKRLWLMHQLLATDITWAPSENNGSRSTPKLQTSSFKRSATTSRIVCSTLTL